MRAVPSIVLGAIAVSALAWAATQGEPYQSLALVAPQGDPVAGRAAFVALGCTSCHGVEGDGGLRAPASANPGPTLGRPPLRHAGVVASAIVSPSHQVRPSVAAGLEGELSPMGDYSEILTVRQLVDVVAYLLAPAAVAPPPPQPSAALRDERGPEYPNRGWT